MGKAIGRFPGGGGGGEISISIVNPDLVGPIARVDLPASVSSLPFGAANGKGDIICGNGNVTWMMDEAENWKQLSDTFLSYTPTEPAVAKEGNGGVCFAGGSYYISSTNYFSAIVTKYDMNGVRSQLTSLTSGRQSMASALDGNGNMMFAGGRASGGNSAVTTVEKYDKNEVKTTSITLSVQRYDSVGATDGNGNVYIATGMTTNGPTTNVDKIDKNGVRTNAAVILQGRELAATATDGNGFVYFAGGAYQSYQYKYSDVDKYDLNGVRTTATPLRNAGGGAAGATDKNGRVYFAGGNGSNGYPTNNVDMYDLNGVRTAVGDLGSTRYRTIGATNSLGYTYFLGGPSGYTNSDVRKVDRINPLNTHRTVVPAFNAFKFLEFNEEQEASDADRILCLNTPNDGYFKQKNGKLIL